MAKFLFVLSRGPEDPTRCTRCFQLAKVAAEKGHDVTMFLVDDAVNLAHLGLTERLKAATGDECVTFLRFLQEKNVPILLCKPCAEARDIGADALPMGFAIDTAHTLIDIAAEAQTFSF